MRHHPWIPGSPERVLQKLAAFHAQYSHFKLEALFINNHVLHENECVQNNDSLSSLREMKISTKFASPAGVTLNCAEQLINILWATRDASEDSTQIKYLEKLRILFNEFCVLWRVIIEDKLDSENYHLVRRVMTNWVATLDDVKKDFPMCTVAIDQVKKYLHDRENVLFNTKSTETTLTGAAIEALLAGAGTFGLASDHRLTRVTFSDPLVAESGARPKLH